MLRKIFAIVAIAVIGVFCFTGCKKSASEAESEEVAVKSMAEYQEEAKAEISEENMAAELEKIEKEIDRESVTQP